MKWKPTKEKQREYNHRWAEKHPDHYREHNRLARRRHILREYGITEAEYAALSLKQGGVCAICKKPEGTRRLLSIDHNHQTGKVRGLLCNTHNRMIGLAHDDPAILRTAAGYLD